MAVVLDWICVEAAQTMGRVLVRMGGDVGEFLQDHAGEIILIFVPGVVVGMCLAIYMGRRDIAAKQKLGAACRATAERLTAAVKGGREDLENDRARAYDLYLEGYGRLEGIKKWGGKVLEARQETDAARILWMAQFLRISSDCLEQGLEGKHLHQATSHWLASNPAPAITVKGAVVLEHHARP